MLNKTSKRFPLFLMLCITLTFLIANIAYAHPTTIYVNPASLTDPSSPFTVDIDIDAVSDLYAWEFKLYYNTTILTVSSVGLGPLLNDTVGTANTWGFVSTNDNYNATHGRVYAAQSIQGDLQGATVATTATLANVTFTVDGPSGTTPLSLKETKLVGYNFATKQTFNIAHSTTDGSVTITALPEFPMGLALEVALIVVIIYVWKKKRRPTGFPGQQ